MSTSEFEQYKVDHLFLLIGENSLPNYVAAKLLLNQGGTAYLVHTAATLDEAKRLKKSFESEFKIELRSLDYESDAYYIQKEINAKLNSITSGTIGLNYTGGTKAMSAHSYRTLFYEKINDETGRIIYIQRKGIIFSYLDPRRLEMCIDREDNDRERLKIQPDTLQVSLVTIFQLHGLNLEKKPTQQAQFPELAKELAKVFADKAKADKWFNWYHDVFCKEARKENRKWKSKTDLATLSISVDNLLPEMVTIFREKQLLTNDDKLALTEVKNLGLFREIKYFCEWLDGKWLEHYVLQEIKDIANDQSIQDYGLDFEIPLPGTDGKFQFDVAFTRGYQLFAISCTTDSKRELCKLKLFEAYLRARQMGGDEARVALVCCSDEPDTLTAEIADTLKNRKIAVFGRADLMNLPTKIAEWIVKNDKEAK